MVRMEIKETYQTFIYFIIYNPIVKGNQSLAITPCHYFATDLSHLHKETSTKIRLKIHNYTFNVVYSILTYGFGRAERRARIVTEQETLFVAMQCVVVDMNRI